MGARFYDASGNLLTSNASILDNTAGGTNGEVTKAPTSDVLFDALALKAPLISPAFTTPNIGVASATSLATSAATPLLLTNGQLVNIALTSQTVGATTLTIPNFASVVDTFAFITLAQTLVNKTLTSPTINGTIATTGLTIPAVTLGGTVTLNGQAFDAGAGSARINTTGSRVGLFIVGSNSANGPRQTIKFDHSTPDLNSLIAEYAYSGYDHDGTPALVDLAHEQIVNTNITDGAEEITYKWWGYGAGADNLAMTLSGAGVLAVDLAGSGSAAQVDLFDDYDDAVVLRQGIQQNNRELLADMGVLTRKDTGSGYMMNLQPMVRLLAGGIYQTRQILEDMKAGLEDRLALVEQKLLQRG